MQKNKQFSAKGGKLKLTSLRDASQYHEKKRSEFDKAVAGRNPLVVTITLAKMTFKFTMGIFDEVSVRKILLFYFFVILTFFCFILG